MIILIAIACITAYLSGTLKDTPFIFIKEETKEKNVRNKCSVAYIITSAPHEFS